MTKNKFEALTEAINQRFSQIGPDEIDKLSITYEQNITEMFEVKEIESNQTVTLSCLFDDIEIKPVLIPKSIYSLLTINDTFLMTLGRKAQVWEPISMSPPYSEQAVQF